MNTFRRMILQSVMVCSAGVMSCSGTAIAQTSSELMRNNPLAPYGIVKRIMQDYLSKGMIKPYFLTASTGEQMLQLTPCHRGREYLMGSDQNELLSAMADLAYEAVVSREGLIRSGYLQERWFATLAEREATMLGFIVREASGSSPRLEDRRILDLAFATQLADDLNGYRQMNSGRNLPKVIPVGGCGGGELIVKIRTQPRGGQVMYIPQFLYWVCRAQNVEPEDFHQCDWWREALDEVSSDVSGDYVYIATWPDGAVRRGTLSITNKNMEGGTITIRKPGG